MELLKLIVLLGIILSGVLIFQVTPLNDVDVTEFTHLNLSAMLDKSLIARGIPVETSFYSVQEAVITHGVIEIDNRSQKAHQAAIRRVICYLGEETVSINSFFLYRLPDYEELDFTRFEQPPLTTSQYEVSFPFIPALTYLNRDIQVEVELSLNGETILLRSPYTITIRTKK
jgi:hypothetical protein